MNYLFHCPECIKDEERNIRIEDYDKEKTRQICSKCGNAMKRVIEAPSKVNLCSGTYNADNNITGTWQK